MTAGLLETEFAANREHLARTHALAEVMAEEVARREALNIGCTDPRAKLFAGPPEIAKSDPAKDDDFTSPIFGERVYAVADRLGRSMKFLGYSDDPETVAKMMSLSDAWKIVREPSVEDSISDEWLGRAPLPPTAHERIVEEREAWDDYEFAKTHREQVAEQRFEYRGQDARGGFADADEKARRQHADAQLQLELEHGAEVLGDERHRAALRERKRFRAYVEAFGQDPDSPEIASWPKEVTDHSDSGQPIRRGYARCNAKLRAKALKDGVLLPSVS